MKTLLLRYKYAAFYSAIAIIILSLLSLVGWFYDNENLKSVIPGYTTMKISTAVVLILLSFSLIINFANSLHKYKLVGQIMALSAVILGTVGLEQNFVQGNILSELMYSLWENREKYILQGKISFYTSSCFLFSGLALLLANSNRPKLITISQYLLHTVTFVSGLELLGYIFNLQDVYSYNRYNPMAVHTAVCFVLFSIAASLQNYRYGLTRLFTGTGIGNIMARKLFIKISAAMLVVSFLDSYTIHFRLMFRQTNSLIFTVLIIIICLGFIWQTSKKLNSMEYKMKVEADKLNSVFEALPNALVIADEKGKILLANKETERLFGYTKDELIGKRIEMLLPERYRASHPEKRKRFFVHPSQRKYSSEAELYAIDKTGHEFPIELGLTPLKTEETLVGLAIVVDITERKKNERIIKDQLRELKIKNQEMEQFNYIASHDLQEPLRTVSNYIELLREEYPEIMTEEINMHIDEMQQATTRMSRLIRHLLKYGLIGNNKHLGVTNTATILSEVKADLKGLISTSSVEIYYDTPLPEIVAYETELRQLFQNLINNAIKFCRKDVPCKINIGYNADNDEDKHEFYVTDNGIGINEKYYNNIFNIFQRLNSREDYEGYGVGLANCKKIAEMHDGKIWVESHLGEGSTFRFTISKHLTEE
ncbi:sensor histidine kinase [Flavobacterium sp. RHBU_3]|uniref:sensor histidine kinase n=1 Tax=Flavobacterium sp. RHBU_3 TaxID=3391184 RepID=UPI00398522E2